MDGMHFREEDIQDMMNSPIYRAIVADVRAVIAEKVREKAMAAERNRVDEMRREREGFLDVDAGGFGRNVVVAPKVVGVVEENRFERADFGGGLDVGHENPMMVPEKVGSVEESRVTAETAFSADQVQPIQVGELGVVTREYDRFESTIGSPRKCADILTTSESHVVEECISVNEMLSRNASGNTVDLSVNEVTERTLECALGVPCYPSIGSVRPVGAQSVRVVDGDVELAFGPAARYLRGVLGSGVAVGVFLAWYARAVARGYAGSVALEKEGIGWRIVPVRHDPLDCLRFIVKKMERFFVPSERKVQLRCENVNPHEVSHPYQQIRREFPNDCCAELLRGPYSYVVSAITDTFVGDGLDVAVGSYVGRGLASYTLENTYFHYTCPVSGQGVELPDETLEGFGRCAEYLALNRVNGKVALAVYVAWCVWLARRGVVVNNRLCRFGDLWRVKKERYDNPMDSVVAMLTVAAKGFFDEVGRSGQLLKSVEMSCGFKCINVSGTLVDYRFRDDDDQRFGSRPGTRVYT